MERNPNPCENYFVEAEWILEMYYLYSKTEMIEERLQIIMQNLY